MLDRRNTDLDMLRGFAVIGTFMAHLPNFGAIPQSLHWIVRAPGWGMGVDVFFVLSGYLITLSLMADRNEGLRSKLGGFWRKRVFRILPASVVWSVLAGSVSIALAYGNDTSGVVGTLRSSLANLLNVSNFYWSHCINEKIVGTYCGGGANLSVWWSLSLEEQFYIVFPLILLLLGTRTTAFLAAAIALIYFCQHRYFPTIVWMTRLDGLCLGVFLAVNKGKSDAFLTLVPTMWLRVIGFLSVALMFGLGGMAYRHAELNRYFFALCVVLAAVAVAVGSQNRSVFRIPGMSKTMNLLGLASYSFYLCHETFLTLVAWGFEQVTGHVPRKMEFILMGGSAFALSFAAAVVSMHLVERPFLRFQKPAPIPRSATTT